MSAEKIVQLGLHEALRDGGRFGIPSEFIKNLGTSLDISALSAYLDLMMEPKDRTIWKWVNDASGLKINSIKVGVGKQGIDYAAITLSDPGVWLPITLFLYETPKRKLNFYCPRRGNIQINHYPYCVCSGLSGKDITEQKKETAKSYVKQARHIIDDLVPSALRHPYRLRSAAKWYDDKWVVIDKDGIKLKQPDPHPVLVVGASMAYMIEDFEHRVVQKTITTTEKPKKEKKVLGGPGKELLIVHPDAEDWLSYLFGYKTRGIYTGMSSGNPDAPTPDDVRGWGVDYPIYQFDKGILYERTISGSRDRAVWRLDEFDEYLEYPVIEKIKKMYPGIQPSDIFMSDED